jgi:hypothetical protein
MALRFGLVALAVLGLGCGDDTVAARPDMHVSTPGHDMSATPVDAARCGGTFSGFEPGAPLTVFSCSCGCTIDSFMHADVLPIWTVARSGSSQAVGTSTGVETLLEPTSANPVAVLGLISQAQMNGFFLDGDFDLLVDYSFGGTAPPGELHLILGTRLPTLVLGTEIYDVERARLADGRDVYRSQLGGVPPQDTATAATQGTLELIRKGLTTTTLADGKRLGAFTAASGGRLEITLSAALSGCSDGDAGTCTDAPRWISLRLNGGTIVNQP